MRIKDILERAKEFLAHYRRSEKRK